MTYYERHREEILAKRKIFHEQNRERLNSYLRQRYAKDPEKYKKQVHEYQQRNKEVINTRRRQKYAEDTEFREKVKIYNKIWQVTKYKYKKK